MQDINAIVYKRREGGEVYYRFIVNYNRLKQTSYGPGDFTSLDEMIEALWGAACPGDNSLGPSSLQLSKEPPSDGYFTSGFSDGGNRLPLDEDEFEKVRQALEEGYRDKESEL